MSERLAGILVSSFTRILIPGIKVTIPLTLLSFVFGCIIALFLALVQIANVKGLKQFARFYIWVFRGTPLIVQLFIIFFGLPSVGIILDAFPSAVIAFALNLGAYNAEIFRSAIQAVPEGQTEAAYMVGLSYRQTMTRIVMPQAFRIAFPPLFNSLIGLTKDTSLASSITVVELFTTAQQIAARTYEPFALYCEAAVIYLIICTVLTWVQNYFEKKLVWNAPSASERRIIMSYISKIDPETAGEKEKEVIRNHLAQGYRLTNEKLTLLHNAEAFKAIEDSSYTLDRELQRLIGKRAGDFFEYAISEENDCLVCSTYFRKLLKDNGIDFDNFQFTKKEELLISFGRALAKDPKNIPDEIYTELKEEFTEEEIVVITAMGVLMVANNYFNDILKVEV